MKLSTFLPSDVAIKRAYPNYYLDSEAFATLLARAISEADAHENKK